MNERDVGAPERRPRTDRDWTTADLPSTPQRDFLIPATHWLEAPDWLVALGHDFGVELVAYKRRIGRYLLWRAGPAKGSDARYAAVASDDLTRWFSFRMFSDGSGEGVGADAEVHTRFRTWKESLRDDGVAQQSA